MIGLIFYGAIGFWLLVAFVLGYKIPLWLKLQPIWAWLFIPLVFFAPVIDEVIAIPQAYALCKQAEDAFWYDSTARSKVIKKGVDVPETFQKSLGPTISAKVTVYTINSLESGKPVIKEMVVNFSSGFLNMPAGSSGTSMPLILPEECPSPLVSGAKVDATMRELNLTVKNL